MSATKCPAGGVTSAWRSQDTGCGSEPVPGVRGCVVHVRAPRHVGLESGTWADKMVGRRVNSTSVGGVSKATAPHVSRRSALLDTTVRAEIGTATTARPQAGGCCLGGRNRVGTDRSGTREQTVFLRPARWPGRPPTAVPPDRRVLRPDLWRLCSNFSPPAHQTGQLVVVGADKSPQHGATPKAAPTLEGDTAGVSADAVNDD